MEKFKPVVLVVLDGWGQSNDKQGNAIAMAKLPTIARLDQRYPKTLLQASGTSVGLPWNECGNSEVGHQSMGTGQIIYQNLPRISIAIEDNSFFENQILKETMARAKNNGSALHLFGLLSDGAVHSHIDHLFALLEMAREQKLEKVFVHAITDGRDTPPKNAGNYINQLLEKTKALGLGQLATICGRFYSMDRNNNWNRTQAAFEAMVLSKGEKSADPIEAINNQYQQGITDEFLKPIVLVDQSLNPIGPIQDNDSVIFFNYREDRAKQIVAAFTQKDFSGFDVSARPKNLNFVGMIQYDEHFDIASVFPPQKPKTCLGQIISQNNLRQLRVAESEKYAHVTYFFNAGTEKPFAGEEHLLIPSKKVTSYDQVPQMSAPEITEKLIEEIKKGSFDFILVNYANADMVGHTGNLEAGIRAIETVDDCLSKLIPAVLEKNGCLLITADHGNIEEMINLRTGEKDTEHSCNPVPCWLVTPTNHSPSPKNNPEFPSAGGFLSDIAPTVLELLQIKKPSAMESESLISHLS